MRKQHPNSKLTLKNLLAAAELLSATADRPGHRGKKLAAYEAAARLATSGKFATPPPPPKLVFDNTTRPGNRGFPFTSP
jgi:hypothetical protein